MRRYAEPVTMILRALVLFLLATPALAADWVRTVAATPRGYVMGNPAAKVKLVEYASYTCPHCRVFQQEGVASLKAKYVSTGKVSFEFRSFVRNGPDYAASLLAACDGVARFYPVTEMLFAAQPEWIKGFETIDEATAAKLQAVPQDKQVAALAKAGGLTAFMAGKGLPLARAERCLADKAAADRLTATLKAAVETDKVNGTPGFLINGALQTMDSIGSSQIITTWADLEPRIVKALR